MGARHGGLRRAVWRVSLCRAGIPTGRPGKSGRSGGAADSPPQRRGAPHPQDDVAVGAEHLGVGVVELERVGGGLLILDGPLGVRHAGLVHALGQAAAAGKDVHGRHGKAVVGLRRGLGGAGARLALALALGGARRRRAGGKLCGRRGGGLGGGVVRADHLEGGKLGVWGGWRRAERCWWGLGCGKGFHVPQQQAQCSGQAAASHGPSAPRVLTPPPKPRARASHPWGHRRRSPRTCW